MFFIIIFGLTLLGGSPGWAQSLWPTTEFDIDTMGAGLFGSGVDDSKLEAMALHAERVAEYYEALGFLPPDLPIVGLLTKKYQLVLDFDPKYPNGETKAQGTTTCRPSGVEEISFPKHIYPSLSASTPGLGYRIKYEIAHELFHAVQRSYPGLIDCGRALWILEGTAEAISISFMRDIGVSSNFNDCDFYRDFGQYELAVADFAKAPVGTPCRPDAKAAGRADYGSSAIWRFLALSSFAGGTPSVNADEANFTYLHHFFSGLAETPVSSTAVYENLDKFLGKGRRKTALRKTELRQAFSEAVSWLAGRAFISPTVIHANNPNELAKAKSAYLNNLFRPGCEDVTLTGQNFVRKKITDFGGMRARCFLVKIDPGLGVAQVVVEAKGGEMDRLSIGLGGGRAVAPMNIYKKGGQIVRSTRIVELGVGRDLLVGTPIIVTYVPSDFNDRQKMSTDLTFALPGFNVNIAPPTKQGGGGVLTDQPISEATAQEADQVQANSIAAASSTTTSRSLAMSTLVSRDESSSACHGDDPFVYLACGPKMTIRLATFPNAAPDLSVTRASGGTFAQVATAGQALSELGTGANGDEWSQAAIKLENQIGNSVTLTFPLIGYGETASFSNALIYTNDGSGTGVLKTVGPEDNIIGRGIGFRLKGQVTIDHYSEDYISGSYSGLLANDQVNFVGEDPTLPTAGQISGTFFAVMPLRGDRNYEYLPYDIFSYQNTQSGGGLGSAGPSAGGQSTATGNSGGSQSSGASSPVDCDCQCGLQALTKDVAECSAICEPVWELLCPL